MGNAFPDGTEIGDWFEEYATPEISELGTRYDVTDYGIRDDGKVYTEAFQKLINLIAANGGGVAVLPAGTFVTGAIWLKQGVNLYLEEGATILGSDDIADYPVVDTRIEGENCLYYPALINGENLDGLFIGGRGVIDGNGLKSWEAFWKRRHWNPSCTNKDEQRARLLFLSGCSNVTISGITMQNSMFWTSHIYKCRFVKFLGLHILSPKEPVKAPSTDAIDIDVCSDVLVKSCFISVNDDAVALKGGKGPNAHNHSDNGVNERIIIEDCHYGFCHGCLTFGSESIHDRNIIMRRIKVDSANNLLWLKFRPDTVQHYELCSISEVEGDVDTFINVFCWNQFASKTFEQNSLPSKLNDIAISNAEVNCRKICSASHFSGDFSARDFKVQDVTLRASNFGDKPDYIEFNIRNIV